ncbi:MAG: hypothetical protein V5A31_10175 [Haloferacaceae archaeon]
MSERPTAPPRGDGDETDNGGSRGLADRQKVATRGRGWQRFGFYAGAPRRNVLVALVYLLVVVVLCWLLDLF